MVKKKKRSKNSKNTLKSSDFEIDLEKNIQSMGKDADRVERDVEKEVEIVEKWMIERRKFLKKLGWALVLITILLIISHFFLRVPGVGA